MCVLSAGDSILMTLPMSVRAERVQDSRADYSSLHVRRVILHCCCTRTAAHSWCRRALHRIVPGFEDDVCNAILLAEELI